MRNSRSQRGFSLLEVTIGAALTLTLLGGTFSVLASGTDSVKSTTDASIASNRAIGAVQVLAKALRGSSLGSLKHADGTSFETGTSGTSFTIQAIQTETEPPTLGAATTYRFALPAGAAEGSLVEESSGASRVLATGVTAFTISRTNELLTLDVRTRSGPADDRRRTARATVEITPRNR